SANVRRTRCAETRAGAAAPSIVRSIGERKLGSESANAAVATARMPAATPSETGWLSSSTVRISARLVWGSTLVPVRADAAHGKVPNRADPRRHDHSAARTGAARRPHADRRPAPARGDPRPRGLRVPRGLGRRLLRLGGEARRREPVGADPRAEVARPDAARARAPWPLPRRL